MDFIRPRDSAPIRTEESFSRIGERADADDEIDQIGSASSPKSPVVIVSRHAFLLTLAEKGKDRTHDTEHELFDRNGHLTRRKSTCVFYVPLNNDAKILEIFGFETPA